MSILKSRLRRREKLNKESKVGRKKTRPRGDSNSQSSDPKSDALSIRPRGRSKTITPKTLDSAAYIGLILIFALRRERHSERLAKGGRGQRGVNKGLPVVVAGTLQSWSRRTVPDPTDANRDAQATCKWLAFAARARAARRTAKLAHFVFAALSFPFSRPVASRHETRELSYLRSALRPRSTLYTQLALSMGRGRSEGPAQSAALRRGPAT